MSARERGGWKPRHPRAGVFEDLPVGQATTGVDDADSGAAAVGAAPLPRKTARGVRSSRSSGSVVLGWAVGITTPMTRSAGDTALPSPGVDEARPDAAPRQAGESTVPRTRGNRKELEAIRRREASDIVI